MLPPVDNESRPVIRALGQYARSRAEIAALTGWSRNTVAARLNALIDDGWIIEDNESQGERGRPFVRYRVNPQAALVFAADFGWDQLNGAICTLSGRVVKTGTLAFNLEEGAPNARQAALSLLQQLTESASIDASRIAVGVIGLPSPVANPGQFTSWAEASSIPKAFGDALGFPVLVENDANLMALGVRHEFPNAQTLLFIKVATGIGAGMVLSGRLHKGALGLSGEVGHIPVKRGAGIPCACGNTGCLNRVASVPAICQQVTSEERVVSSVDELRELIFSGEPEAAATLRQAGRDIGEALSPIATGIAPDVIVLGGRITQIGSHLTTGVRESLTRLTLPALSAHVRVTTTPDHWNAALRGAVIVAFDHLFPAGAGGLPPTSA